MKPAIFNTDMVRAILDDRKTNTRRMFSKYLKKVIDYAYALGEIGSNGIDSDFSDGDKKYLMAFAPHKVGDIIYVRETFSEWIDYDTRSLSRVTYKASDEDCNGKWKPSIHMPKEYARLFLRVKDVRIDRLNEISEEDAEKEGIKCWSGESALINFMTLWESIYGDGSFDNRYVWVIEFERISKEEAMSETAI